MLSIEINHLLKSYSKFKTNNFLNTLSVPLPFEVAVAGYQFHVAVPNKIGTKLKKYLASQNYPFEKTSVLVRIYKSFNLDYLDVKVIGGGQTFLKQQDH